VLASNPIFDDLLDSDLHFTRWDPNALAERIRGVAAMSLDERAALGRRLRARVAESHSVQSWAHGILDAAGIA
jgi:trehalose-6-phosphate synthase